ncbi:inositol monophosphatase family protein [Enterobacteriaceae endosymbiont of Neohaemonia nigricornis]|uniref:inositol monophosphatase family protein n=1 Tax=Enterobacteriaceae endosymbiont of Neohaemonia nigricornis TaxID=2675792 RepID=UPI001449FA21|nr:inositol monophosphatase family protein [Enterobacteriaceae endosymbiont of Neohaemonia nigricornis]QJC30411.1 inositol monophosphatase [Enterobacteriaceae endosymbiont of Neohaemonia nigricornis]
MRPMLNVAIRIVRQIGDIVLQYYEIQKKYLNHTENYNFIIIKMLRLINKITIKSLNDIYSKNIIVSNKKELLILKYKKTTWIINPLDGIVNFIKKLPHFAISIAICIHGKTEVSLVYDPLRNDLFTAIRGQNTQLNGYKIRCTKFSHKKDNNFLLGLNPDYIFYSKNNINFINILHQYLVSLRVSGSIALDLAYVSSNKINCYINNNITDFYYFIAGELLIKESGGLLTDFIGHYNYKYSKNILVAHSHILQLLLSQKSN